MSTVQDFTHKVSLALCANLLDSPGNHTWATFPHLCFRYMGFSLARRCYLWGKTIALLRQVIYPPEFSSGDFDIEDLELHLGMDRYEAHAMKKNWVAQVTLHNFFSASILYICIYIWVNLTITGQHSKLSANSAWICTPRSWNHVVPNVECMLNLILYHIKLIVSIVNP